MAKKTKRFKQGDIVVNATKPVSDSGLNMRNLDYRLPPTAGGGGRGGGGGGRSTATRITPTVINTPAPYMGSMAGSPPKAYGVTLKKRFKKGGSAASKRADGCATKGKTKGKMV
jgi:hypothetical protein